MEKKEEFTPYSDMCKFCLLYTLYKDTKKKLTKILTVPSNYVQTNKIRRKYYEQKELEKNFKKELV